VKSCAIADGLVYPTSIGWNTIAGLTPPELKDATGSAPAPLSGIEVTATEALEVSVSCPVYVCTAVGANSTQKVQELPAAIDPVQPLFPMGH